MKDDRGNNGTNGNGNNGTLDDLTNKEMLKILLEEIANVRIELKKEIQNVHIELSGRMDKLDGRMDNLETEFRSLRIEVHQNQITFMNGHEALEKRMTVVEQKVG